MHAAVIFQYISGIADAKQSAILRAHRVQQHPITLVYIQMAIGYVPIQIFILSFLFLFFFFKCSS